MTVAVIIYGTKSMEGIATVLRRLHIPYKLYYPNEIPNEHHSHIILSGGPKHVYDSDIQVPAWIINSPSPVLGICFGMQLIAKTFGGVIKRLEQKEEGMIDVIELINNEQIIRQRYMNRYDYIYSLPDNFTITGITKNNCIATFTDYNKWWCVQYHPESNNAIDVELFRRFLSK